MSKLQNEIGSLSAEESLQAEGPVVTDEQRDELDCRLAAYEQNPADVISWEKVRAGLFKKRCGLD